MRKITKAQYEYANARMDELLKQITEETKEGNPMMLELDIFTYIVEEYENEHLPKLETTLGYFLCYGRSRDKLLETGTDGRC